MKTILEYYIRKRNPAFRFHESITDFMLIEFTINRFVEWLRGFKLLLRGKLPSFLFLGSNVTFQFCNKITLGKFVRIDKQTFLSALGKGGIHIGNNSGIGAFSRLIVSTTFNNPGEYIKIGNNVGIGEYAYLGGAAGLEIGDACIIGQYLSCHPENHIYDNIDVEIRHQGTTRKGIKIGSNCWIGSKVTVLDGVTIGSGCIIAAGAVVTSGFPDNSVIGGVPAKLLKERKSMNI